MGIVTIRGAITVDENNDKMILKDTEILLKEIMKKNSINSDNIISVLFTATKDLDQVYPAKAARNIGLTNCSLLCFQEMDVKNSLKKCIRVLMMINLDKNQSEVNHVYLKGARELRKDL